MASDVLIHEDPKPGMGSTEVTRMSYWPVELLNNLAPKNRIYGILEIDVTKARKFISDHELRTGEKLSFTAWITKCIAQAVNEHKNVQAIKKGSMKLVVFDDVDVGLMIERKSGTQRITYPYIVRKANEKSFQEIHNEIRQEQNPNGKVSLIQDTNILKQNFFKLPGFVRKIFWYKVKSDPILRKSIMGTVGVTAVGMFGSGGGWALPIGLHSLVFGIGGITKKPVNLAHPNDMLEFINITVMFDEEVSLGAPATRFIARLSNLMQEGFGLD